MIPTTSTTDSQWIVKSLSALAQINRLNVFRQLVVAGPEGMYPSDMATALGVPSNSLSFHLKELLHCELITQEREGRNLRYRANVDKMQSLIGFLVNECCQGQPCITLPSMECAATECDSKHRSTRMST